ncbi:MAG: DUF3604 domain-containing protein [Nannocystaceae bacterium]
MKPALTSPSTSAPWCLLGLVIVALTSCSNNEPLPEPWEDVREPCADNNPLRNVYYGDLHVHTSNSFDAAINDVDNGPAEAYRFAKGEPVMLPPLGRDGQATQTVQLARPLDFAAVTDHAEFLAEVHACKTPGTEAYDSDLCQDFRAGTTEALVQFGIALSRSEPERFGEICGASGVDCLALAGEVWSEQIAATEAAYDRTDACEFTAFVGYEWSAARQLSNLHRNIIFRSNQVPSIPVSHFEEPEPEGLWARLRKDCIDDINGCDVLSIPHNSNWSNGKLFNPNYSDTPEDRSAALLQARIEPLMEIYQHKGDSECQNGVSGILGAPDEFCNFEKLRTGPFDDCGDGVGGQGMVNGGCVSRRDFVRGALLRGLQQAEELGINPLKLGIMASTDTHNGTPGMVAEDTYPGHFGRREQDATARLTGSVPAGPRNSPGGLIAVWSEENSREALFDAMRRREVFGTSGPRLAVRLFAGWNYPDDLCDDPKMLQRAYDGGVPMGGDLPANPGEFSAPKLLVSALKDPGTSEQPGTPLQRVQIVKGWLDGEGQRHLEVVDVVGEDTGASVNLDTCEPVGSGADSLCTVWQDPNFKPGESAFYYARVLENPVCRWSTRDCDSLPDNDDRPKACDDPTIPKTIQERAWTSPIWVEPS